MRHDGQPYDALRSTVGAAAKMTVVTRAGATKFSDWKPRPGAEESFPRAPPMSDADLVASLTPPDERRILEPSSQNHERRVCPPMGRRYEGGRG
jgi:hypothetical protein